MEELLFDETEDWESRVLCSDESCIGTIGPDGRCKECGKPYDGVLQDAPSTGNVTAETNLNKTANLPLNQEISKESGSENSTADEEWENRVLCSDGCCIGIIGPDGKCKECGKPGKQ
ncbi:MAG: hypothetical protein L7F78_03085 [Syntrophales bacterium LBB04]|nr:hypothetical protein [Syntrophales bacterium LBB04]